MGQAASLQAIVHISAKLKEFAMSSVAPVTKSRAKEIVSKLAKFYGPDSAVISGAPDTGMSPDLKVGGAVYHAMGKLGASAAALSIVAASLAPQAAQAHAWESIFESPAAMAEVLSEQREALEKARNDAAVELADQILDPMEKAAEASPKDFFLELPMGHGPSDGIYPQGELGDQMKMADIVKDIYPMEDGGQVYFDAERLLEVQRKISDLTSDVIHVLPEAESLREMFCADADLALDLTVKGPENWTAEERLQFENLEKSITDLHAERAPEMLSGDYSPAGPFKLRGQVDAYEAEREMVPHLQVHLIRLDVQILGGGLHDSTTPHVMLKKQLDVLDQISQAETFTSHHAEIVRKIAEETGFGGPDNDVSSQIRADFVDEPTNDETSSPKL